MTLPVQLSSDHWIDQFFSAQAVGRGGVVRRKAADIDRLVGRERFLHEVSLRGFRAVENNGQILVFCNQAPVRILL